MDFWAQWTQADGQLLIGLQRIFVHDGLTPVMKAISLLGDAGAFWILLCLALIAFRKTRKIGILAGVSLVLCFICCNLCIKPAVDRTRPWILFDQVMRLIPDPGDSSFPSGHSAASMAPAMAILLNGANKKYGAAAVTLAILIGFSRLYLGVHFPSDVCGGLILGVICACIVYYANKWRERSLNHEVSNQR